MKSRKGQWIINIILILLVAMMAGLSSLSKLENFWFDGLLKSGGSLSTDIVIIGIDDKSIKAIGRMPWDRNIYADLLNHVSAGKPAVIGFDLVFAEASNPLWDNEFARAIKNAPVILPNYGMLNGQVTTDNELMADYMVEPLEILAREAIGIGHINTLPDTDSLIRKTIPYIVNQETGEKIPSFHYQLYEIYALKNNIKPLKLRGDYFNRPFIQYVGLPGTVETLSFLDCMSGKIPPAYFEGKIVIVGDTASGTTDNYYTPASGEAAMFGVEIHATCINNLLFNEYKLDFLGKNIIIFGDRLSEIRINISNVLQVIIFAIMILAAYVFCQTLWQRSIVSIVLGGIYAGFSLLLYKQGYLLQFIYPLLLLIILFTSDIIFAYWAESREKIRIMNVFSRYMADTVVEKIIEEGEDSLRLGGDKKEIAVIFFDIRGFTSISEKLNPAVVVEMLNEFLTIPTDIIFKNNGMLDKYMGDSIMASFNMPYPIDDYAYMAVLTAIEVIEKMDEVSLHLLNKYGALVQFGIGINVGEAIVGNIGSPVRMDYTAIGDTVNVAARLESMALPNQILVSDSIYKAVGDRFIMKELGYLALKGREAPMLTFEVLGRKE